MVKLSETISKQIDLNSFHLSESYYYNSLPLCVIDSVYSIGVKYESVKNVISSFCEYEKIQKHRVSRKTIPKISEQYKVSDFLNKFNDYSNEKLAKEIFRNSQRTSSRSGILKSQAVVEFLRILKRYEIDTFQDLMKSNNDFKNDILKIKGQKSGISLQYFYMLAGSEELIKPDRMIIRFLEANLNRKVSFIESLEIIKSTCQELKTEYSIEITPRELDNAIWNYQRKA